MLISYGKILVILLIDFGFNDQPKSVQLFVVANQQLLNEPVPLQYTFQFLNLGLKRKPLDFYTMTDGYQQVWDNIAEKEKLDIRKRPLS